MGNPAAINYGTTLSGTQLIATASVPGTFAYTPAAGSTPATGSDTLSVTFTPTDTTDYSNQSATVTLLVNKVALAVTGNNASMTYGGSVPGLSASISGFVNGDTQATAVTGSPSVSTTATSSSAVGTYPITVSLGTLSAANYSFTYNSGTLTVNKATSTSTLTTSNVIPTYGLPVMLTDTIAVVNGVPPTGVVSFYLGSTLLGTATPNASGVATLTTTSLPTGTDYVTAMLAADANYAQETSNIQLETVAAPDFSIAATPSVQTINCGDKVSYTISLAGLNVAFNSAVTLTVTGLPPGATVSFANATYVPGVGPTPTTMTIVTSPTQARLGRTVGARISITDCSCFRYSGFARFAARSRRYPTESDTACFRWYCWAVWEQPLQVAAGATSELLRISTSLR